VKDHDPRIDALLGVGGQPREVGKGSLIDGDDATEDGTGFSW
jgi:hypothetical protein